MTSLRLLFTLIFIAETVKNVYQQKLGKTIVTEIRPAMTYWLAEDYHQNYLLKRGYSNEKGDPSYVPCYA